jgi:uncharacterized integral membrane protein
VGFVQRLSFLNLYYIEDTLVTLSIENYIIMVPRYAIALILVGVWCICADARPTGTFTYVLCLVGVLVLLFFIYVVHNVETRHFQRWFPDPC